LDCSDDDAIDIYNILVRHQGWNSDDVVVLLDSSATFDNIVGWIGAMRALACP
jgi:hypothetical protein